MRLRGICQATFLALVPKLDIEGLEPSGLAAGLPCDNFAT